MPRSVVPLLLKMLKRFVSVTEKNLNIQLEGADNLWCNALIGLDILPFPGG